METIVKKDVYNIKLLKEDIKKFADEQRYLKNQRKTVHLQGEREMQPWEAQMKHALNRERLRIMYAVYGGLRGKKFWDIENNHDKEKTHPLYAFLDRIEYLEDKYYIKDDN